MRGQQRPCKFGNRCNKLANGTCTYFHPPNQLPYSEYPRRENNYSHPPPYNPQQQTQNQAPPFNNQNSYKQKYMGFEPKHPNTHKFGHSFNNHHNYGPKSGFREPTQQNNKFCYNFQLGTDCKYGDKCRHKHGFAFKDETIMRLFFSRGVPSHPQSKLSKFKSKEKPYYSIRNGPEVVFYEFNSQAKEFTQVFRYNLAHSRCHHFQHKNHYLYYATQNSNTLLDDMTIYDISQDKAATVNNSHYGKITAIAHYDQNVIFSASMAGELKVWQLNDNELICNQEETQKLKSQYNPQNAKIQLYFVDINYIDQTKVIAVGTSDARVLFFFDKELNFFPLTLPQQYTRIYKIRYLMRQSGPMALLLTWNKTNTLSSIIEVNLVDLSFNVLMQFPTTQDKPQELLNICELVHGYLIIANLGGLVSIYNYPDTSIKVGSILHRNQISEILECSEELINTNMSMNLAFILEKKTENNQGSLGVYLIK